MPIPQKKTKEQPKTARERVYTEVREWIVNGTLQPGEKISDQEISQYFSVSRTPVREAIQMLSDQKLVDIFPGKETRVAPLNTDEAVSTYRIMAELHALAVELAYPKLTKETFEEMKRADLLFCNAEKRKNVEEASQYDQFFHDIFLRLAGDYFLSEFTNILLSHIQRIENIYYKKSDSVSFESHHDIIAALERQDLPAAKDAMRNNWIHTLERVQALEQETDR
ncbi:MAG: GntR family transcriptional regulator [Eubacteriales bacterium]|nr:GntR family transcriptional regulator [Eubacteriales bacterium]